MKKDIGLLNRIAKLEARQAAHKGFARALDPAAHDRRDITRWKIHNIKPGSPWTDQLENEYQARLSRLPPAPPLTDADKRLMALPYLQTSSNAELMAALKARMAGQLPSQHGRQLPVEPLLNPTPARTAERTEVGEQPDIPQPTPPVRRDDDSDRLADYRDQGGLPYFEND